MISNAAHFSLQLNQSMKSLVKISLTEIRNFVIICEYRILSGIILMFQFIFMFFSVGHWLLLAYGIISLHQHLAFLVLVPFPAIFYILTVRFTDPSEFRDKDNEDRNN